MNTQIDETPLVRIAYSYVRFSTEIQKKGQSLSRQTDAASEWCKANNYRLSEDKFLDLGKSAFKGKHLGAEGDLRRFLSLVEAGRIRRGSVLVLEEFSRLSRLPITEAVNLFTSIMISGIGIVFTMAHGQKVLTKKAIDGEPYILYQVLGEAQRAHEESRIKSERILQARKKRRDAASQGVHFKYYCPPWCDFVGGRIVRNDAKVKIVHQIFKMYLGGKGAQAIAVELNRDKVPYFGGRKEKNWYKKVVKDLLLDKRLVGYAHWINKENYFPCVLDPKIFNQAQFRWSQQAKNTKGQNGKGIINIFAGLMKCGNCGGTICKTRSINSQGYEYVYLTCENARTGKPICSYRSVLYNSIENSFIQLMAYRPWFREMLTEKPADDTEAKIEAMEGELLKISGQTKKLNSMVLNEENLPSNLVQMMRELENREKELKQQIAMEKGKKIETAAPQYDDHFFETLPDKMEAPEYRLKIREVLRTMIRKITLHVHGVDFPHFHVERVTGSVWSVVFTDTTKLKCSYQILKGRADQPNDGEVVFTSKAA